MNYITILTEPAIIVIILAFLFCITITLCNYTRVKKNLNRVYLFLKNINKKELSYRFNELNNFMIHEPFTSIQWEDFKKALIFPEKLYTTSNTPTNGTNFNPEIYLTIDASYFFNEETLVLSKINHKFIQTMPTLLTGLGPFFTFLKMAFAFTAISFVDDSNIGAALNGLISNIQIAALCSVFAVGFSLTFLFLEKIMYNKMCKRHYLNIQKELIRIFDVATSEKFLLDLVKESKIQNMTNEKHLKDLPENFAKAVGKSLGETTIPYLENILYSLNKLNDTMGKNSSGDVVDKLF